MPSFHNENVQDTEVATDRRRRGRTQTDNPHLITLFRDPIATQRLSEAENFRESASPAVVQRDEHDPRAVARGIAFGVLGGVGLWAVVCFGVWYLL
jgi:hypothetical protein